jgi:hypothetical protein
MTDKTASRNKTARTAPPALSRSSTRLKLPEPEGFETEWSDPRALSAEANRGVPIMTL